MLKKPRRMWKEDYLPKGTSREYYHPTDLGFEKTIKAWLKQLKRPQGT